jgi:hypothetical protein
MLSKTKVALSVAMIAGALGAASAAWAGGKDDADAGQGGFVTAGSTVGVNPAYHQDIFGSAGKAYGYAALPGQMHRPSNDQIRR